MASIAEKRMATAIIVLVLACQFFAIVAQVNRWGWPFTDYPMYSWPHYEGERILAYPVVFAIAEDGEELEITADDAGLNVYQFIDWARRLAAKNDMASRPSATRRGGLHGLIGSTGFAKWLKGADAPSDQASSLTESIVSRYAEKHGKRIVRLRFEDNGVLVTKHGMQEVPREVLAEIDVATPGE
jgi:hypothetical protein